MSGLNSVGVALADFRVDAVGGDDEVGVGEVEVGIDVALEHEFDADLLAAPLQDVEQMLAADADEAVAGGALALALEDELDVVPMVEGVGDLRRADRIGGAHRLHHRVGEHHAPAERVVGPVALDDGDGMFGMAELHQEPEIEPGRSAADTDDPHLRPRPKII